MFILSFILEGKLIIANLALQQGNFYFLFEIHFKTIPSLIRTTLAIASRANNIIFISKFLQVYPNYDLPGNLIELVSLGHYKLAHLWIERPNKTNVPHCLHYKFSFLNQILTDLYNCTSLEQASIIATVLQFITENYAKEKKLVEAYRIKENLIMPITTIKEMVLALRINQKFPTLKLNLANILMTTFDGNKIPFPDFYTANYLEPMRLIRFLIKHPYEHPLQIISFLLAELCAQQEKNLLLLALGKDHPERREKKSEVELDSELFLALFHKLKTQFNKEKVIPKSIVPDALRLNNGKIIAAIFSRAREELEFKCDEPLEDLPTGCAWKYSHLVYFIKNCKIFPIYKVLHDLFEGPDSNYLDKTYKQFVISQLVSHREITLSEIMLVIQQKSAKLFKALTSAKNFQTLISNDFNLLTKLFDQLQKNPEESKRIRNVIKIAFLYCPYYVNQSRSFFKKGILEYVALRGDLSLVKSLLTIKQQHAKEIQIDKGLLKADLPASISQYLHAIYHLQHLTTMATGSFVTHYHALTEEDELDYYCYAKAINKVELINAFISDYTRSRIETPPNSFSISNKELIDTLPGSPSPAANPLHSFPLGNQASPSQSTEVQSKHKRKTLPKKKYHLDPLPSTLAVIMDELSQNTLNDLIDRLQSLSDQRPTAACAISFALLPVG